MYKDEGGGIKRLCIVEHYKYSLPCTFNLVILPTEVNTYGAVDLMAADFVFFMVCPVPLLVQRLITIHKTINTSYLSLG